MLKRRVSSCSRNSVEVVAFVLLTGATQSDSANRSYFPTKPGKKLGSFLSNERWYNWENEGVFKQFKNQVSEGG